MNLGLGWGAFINTKRDRIVGTSLAYYLHCPDTPAPREEKQIEKVL